MSLPLRHRWALWVLTFAAAVGCRRAPSPEPAPAPVAPSAPVAADRLAPNELAEGTEEAFGFVLPAALHLERRFQDLVAASGQVTPEALSAYVERHIQGGTVELAQTRTVYRGARIRGKSADRQLELEVAREGDRARLLVRDRTPPPLVPGLDSAERWRQSGFDPSGRVTDPKQML